MLSPHVLKRYAVVSFAGVVLAACTGQKGSAEKTLRDIETTVTAASTDATKYLPDQLADTQRKLGNLQASFDKKDYQAVMDGAPPVMSAAHALVSAATAKKELATKDFNEQWTSLSNELPSNINIIQNRIDFLSKQENKALATGVDLEEAKSSLNDADELWIKAQASFSQSNAEDAVMIGNTVKTKLDALAASFKLDLAQSTAVKDTTS